MTRFHPVAVHVKNFNSGAEADAVWTTSVATESVRDSCELCGPHSLLSYLRDVIDVPLRPLKPPTSRSRKSSARHHQTHKKQRRGPYIFLSTPFISPPSRTRRFALSSTCQCNVSALPSDGVYRLPGVGSLEHGAAADPLQIPPVRRSPASTMELG